MKDIKALTTRYQNGALTSANQQSQQVDAQKPEITEQVIQLVNKITKRFEGIYQFTGNRSQEKTNLYKAELTRALYKVRDQITEKNITEAIDYFALQGGKFVPSIPEFIQVLLKSTSDTMKAPEHVWFDSAKALPQYTPEQFQSMGKSGVALAREKLKGK